MNDNTNVSVNIDDTKADWYEKKEVFHKFLVEKLKIQDEDIIERMLEEFDEGLNANIDFRFLLFGLGYQEPFIDNVIITYNAGEKPKTRQEDNKPISSSVINTVHDELNKSRLQYKVKEYDQSAIEQYRKTIEEGLQDIHTGTITPIVSKPNTESILNETVTIAPNANIYRSMADLVANTNGSIPYYDSDVERNIKGVACLNDDQYILVEDAFALENLLANNATIVGYYTEVNNSPEGLYKQDEVIKRGVTR